MVERCRLRDWRQGPGCCRPLRRHLGRVAWRDSDDAGVAVNVHFCGGVAVAADGCGSSDFITSVWVFARKSSSVPPANEVLR